MQAHMVELVDALASGASDRKVVEVRVLLWAPGFAIYPAKQDFLAISKAIFA